MTRRICLCVLSSAIVLTAQAQNVGGLVVRTSRQERQLSNQVLKERCRAIEELARNAFAYQPVGGLTIGVVYKDRLFWTGSFGYSDSEDHVATDENTIYRIGSITKMFTALMLEQLVEKRIVSLGGRVEMYVPELRTVGGSGPYAEQVTFLQLATHTSGLERDPDDRMAYSLGAVSDWEKMLMKALPDSHFVTKPGLRYGYSNVGYAVLGEALSRAGGQSYLAYVSQHILRPLGMNQTTFELTPGMMPHFAKGYLVSGDTIDAKTALQDDGGMGFNVPNGGAYSTVGDLAKFASFLMGYGPEGVLKRRSLMQYQNRLAVPMDAYGNSGYGIGFKAIKRRGNYVAFGHGGIVAGYQSALYINRKTGIGVIVLVNAIGSGMIRSGAVDTTDLALKALDSLSKQ